LSEKKVEVNADKKKEARKFLVQTDTVKVQPIKYLVEAGGSLEAQDIIRVDAPLAGVVENVAFNEGDAVTPETVLCRINSTIFVLLAQKAKDAWLKAAADERDIARKLKFDIESAELNFRLAERDVAKRKPAFDQGAISEDQYLETLDRRVTVEIALKNAREALKMTLETYQAATRQRETEWKLADEDVRRSAVRPPKAGVIEERLISPGAQAAAGTPLARMVVSGLKLKFSLPEAQVNHARVGAEVGFRCAAFPGKIFTAKIYHIAALADSRARQTACWATVNPTDLPLRPGFYASVSLLATAKELAPTIPVMAAMPSERGYVAFTLDGDVARRRFVTLGPQTEDGRVEVLDGLKEGEVVVVEGASSLYEGAPVRRAGVGGDPRTQKAANQAQDAAKKTP
jgi:RND family efflux transporter MFP subunit